MDFHCCLKVTVGFDSIQTRLGPRNGSRATLNYQQVPRRFTIVLEPTAPCETDAKERVRHLLDIGRRMGLRAVEVEGLRRKPLRSRHSEVRIAWPNGRCVRSRP